MRQPIARGIAAGIAMAAAMVTSAVAVPSATAATCTPRTWLEKPFLDEQDHATFVAHYNTCGESMLLSFKSRIYGEGRYEWSVRYGVQGKGVHTFGSWSCGDNEPVKQQFLTTLKIGQTLYAKSAPRTFTPPVDDPPCE